jgi:hypothetical protein
MKTIIKRAMQWSNRRDWVAEKDAPPARWPDNARRTPSKTTQADPHLQAMFKAEG